MVQVQSGLDILLSTPKKFIKGKNIGLLANQTSVAEDGRHSILHLSHLPDFQLVKLFGPEHGLYGVEQDMVEIPETKEPLTGLTIKSLYGNSEATLTPDPLMLEGVDTLIYDVQDIGSRYYTFVNTLANCMKICGETETTIVVCDRPNLINGVQIEGNLVNEKYRSFVGQFPIPNRHGMTTGELAKLFKNYFHVECDLVVIEMEGWTREMWQKDTKLAWIAPSPNIPTLATATVYPGMCFLEGTHLSEGRGTTQPFELCGAPYIDAYVLANSLNQENLPGVLFRPHYFKPMFQKWAGQVCGGVQVHVIDEKSFKPVLTGISVIRNIAQRYSDQFQWRKDPYEFISNYPAIDLLYGNPQFREIFTYGLQRLDEIEESWQKELEPFFQIRKECLLY